jgi:hypothetical protein
MADRAKFILFSVGLAVAIASSVTSFYFLYSSVLGQQSVVYEPNSTLALIEMTLLVLSIGTCLTASEVYYKYLEIRKSIYLGTIKSQDNE